MYISTWMKPGSIRSQYGCQSPRSRELRENLFRPFCTWVVGKLYHPPWNIRNIRQQSMITSSPSPVIQPTSRRKTSFCRVPTILRTKLLQRCDISEQQGSVNHKHRDTMCRQGVGKHVAPMQARGGVALSWNIPRPEKDCVKSRKGLCVQTVVKPSILGSYRTCSSCNSENYRTCSLDGHLPSAHVLACGVT